MTGFTTIAYEVQDRVATISAASLLANDRDVDSAPLSLTAVSSAVNGAVSLVGPTRMDYQSAIAAVRGASHLLSEFVEGLYDG